MPKELHTPKNRIFPMAYVYYMFSQYAKKIENKNKNPLFVNRETYAALIRRFHERVVDKIIFHQYEFKMPYHLGRIFVAKKKAQIYFNENGTIDHKKSKLAVDFNATKKYGKTMYHYNTHTKGYYMRFHWRKNNLAAYVKNVSVYKFEPIHKNKTKLSTAINKYYVKGKIDFYNLDK